MAREVNLYTPRRFWGGSYRCQRGFPSLCLFNACQMWSRSREVADKGLDRRGFHQDCPWRPLYIHPWAFPHTGRIGNFHQGGGYQKRPVICVNSNTFWCYPTPQPPSRPKRVKSGVLCMISYLFNDICWGGRGGGSSPLSIRHWTRLQFDCNQGRCIFSVRVQLCVLRGKVFALFILSSRLLLSI